MNSSSKNISGSETPSRLEDITITSELILRPTHAKNLDEETAALQRISETLKQDPAQIFDICVDVGLQLCNAHSCGISLNELTEQGDDIFRWIAVAGKLQKFTHGTMPRSFSPCGICVDNDSPVLMREPERLYTYIDLGIPVTEVLLIPLKSSRLEGTIWIVAHDETRKFDREDARIMQHIAVFVSTALHLVAMAQDAKAEAAQKDVAFRELQHRVQNTLAMTAGLLRYQLKQTSEPNARRIIEAASGRVLAISRAHHYTDRDGEVDLRVVVSNIAHGLLDADPRFALELHAETVTVSAQNAGVIALIVNELITNAMKYSLAGRDGSVIALSLRRMEGSGLTLCVSDDGASMPDLGKGSRQGTGLDLVRLLAKQLGGELIVEADPKRFSVLIPQL